MDEVDRIILDTLRQIGCDIEEEVTNIGHFDSNMVVDATVRCLELINPGTQLPHSLPPNMATRYRVGQEIAQACIEQGYPGDIGYQTFLYSGETDIRRILMFLVERLPKEDEQFLREPSGSELILKKIKCKVKDELGQLWLPHNSCSIDWTHDFTPATDPDSTPTQAWRQFWRDDLPLDAIDSTRLLPTIVTLHSRGVLSKYHPKSFVTKRPGVAAESPETSEQRPSSSKAAIQKPPIPQKPTIKLKVESQESGVEPSDVIEEFDKLQSAFNNLKVKNLQLEEELSCQHDELVKVKEMNVVKARILELLPDGEDSIQRLEQSLEEYAKKMVHLAKQWEKHRQPLISKYRTSISSHSSRQTASVKKAETARSLSERRREMETELKNKERLLDQLQIESERIGKESNRSAYTRRILEIIGNVDKQKIEISKILKDTQQLQKEINTLTGQLDRCFTLADETIFADAKRDETSRKAYKLLATLHSDCDQLVAMVQETGATLRDIRDLEDQIEKERGKDVAANLERITADLHQMRQESSLLAAKLKAIQGNPPSS